MVAAKVRLAFALVQARVNMSREDIKVYGLESYVIPLPPFAPRPVVKPVVRSRFRTKNW